MRRGGERHEVKFRTGIVAGWDRQEGREGGTWLAMDKKGRLGFLTNIFTTGVIDRKLQAEDSWCWTGCEAT